MYGPCGAVVESVEQLEFSQNSFPAVGAARNLADTQHAPAFLVHTVSLPYDDFGSSGVSVL